MLEFYPMPTNLNNGGALYSHSHHNHHTPSHHHHQNHGTAARFFDNSNNNNNNNNNNNIIINSNNNSSSNNNNNNCILSPMPAATNLQGLVDNSSGSGSSCSSSSSNGNSGSSIIGSQSHQILQMTTTSPAYASCPPITTAHTPNRNIASPTSFETETSLTATQSTTPQGNVNGIGAAGGAVPSSTATVAVSSTASTSTSLSLSPTANNSACNSSSTTSKSTAITSSPTSSHVMSSSLSSAATINPCTVVMLSTALTSNTVATSTKCSSSTSLSSASAAAAAAAAVASTLSSSISCKSSSVDCDGRTEVGHIKCEKLFEICEGCGQKIHDRYLMNVGDTNWHEHCLACCYCGIQLHHTCYVRNTKLYCKLDYDRLFGIKCAACCHPILPQEMVMRPIPNFIFHLSCFICYACRLPLQKGEQFMLRGGQLFCFRHDLEKEMYLTAAQHCGFVGLDDDELMRPRDGRRGPKRPRTILTSQQRKQFKASFDQSPKPCRKVREALAKDTGLSVRVVQVWFQNQRAKMKKIQRKAKNGSGSNNNSGSGGNNSRNTDDKDKDKDEKNVKQESVSGSESGYLGLDSAFASQPLNPNLPFSPDDYPANSNDSFCSSDLSLDGSNFDQLDDDADSLSLNNLELQSTGSSGNHHHHHNNHHHHHHSNPHDMIANLNTSLINPIDKLYLMQNSYFNSEQ